MFNDEFYPTPKSLRSLMYEKIDGRPRRVIDPQAGKGDLLEGLKEHYRYSSFEVFAIEIEPELQALLRGKGIPVIDSDFLAFQGSEFFSLYLMNPPFSNAEFHLLKAIDQIYSGQILCLLNAETLKNPHTQTRQLLVRRLKELGAEVEYHHHAFMSADSERKTDVEVALVDIRVVRKVEDDLFKNVSDAETVEVRLEENHEISTGLNIDELVAEYNQTVKIGTETIINYFRNVHKIGPYLSLYSTLDRAELGGSSESLTETMQRAVHVLLSGLRKDFWRRTLDLNEVRKRLTEKRMKEFEQTLATRECMDFTASNIRSFVLSVINSYGDTITEAIAEIFDLFTARHCFSRGEHEPNIYLFNGWKTNDAYAIRSKVIVPIRASYGNPFRDCCGNWKLDYAARRRIDDIDKVFNYFGGLSDYKTLGSAIDEAFEQGQTRNIKSTYFTVSVFRKGTMHLKFNDEDHVRRLNYIACKHKNFLPGNFGETEYSQMDLEEQAVVDSFEGRESYEKHFGQPLLAESQRLFLSAA